MLMEKSYEMLTLSWLVLQRPPVGKASVVVEPQAIRSPDEPIFPLRARSL
jgi:hypothetical protein